MYVELFTCHQVGIGDQALQLRLQGGALLEQGVALLLQLRDRGRGAVRLVRGRLPGPFARVERPELVVERRQRDAGLLVVTVSASRPASESGAAPSRTTRPTPSG